MMMMQRLRLRLLPILALLIFLHACVDGEVQNQKKTYIIHMDKSNMPAGFYDHLQWYDSSLKSVSDTDMLYSYIHVIHGYSARLTADEAKALEKQIGILSVQEEVKYELHTTRTPKFLGLDGSDTKAFFLQNNIKSDVIIGVLDTGVWPESKSFDDTGLGPVPSSWKGGCEVGNNFNSSNCNRKLIGARFFLSGYEGANGPIDEAVESRSPRDDDGHGTHTASTAAGSTITRASFFGFGAGTARGMAPQARVAAYKVCWEGGCFSSDILAAMEKAIEDGVNIISMSLGGAVAEYYSDPIAIGAFAATSRGIFVSCSAGNSGPFPESLSNPAPWIATIGAGTIDRKFPGYISIGNGKKFDGVSLYSGKPLSSSPIPLVYAGNASTSDGRLCTPGSLIPAKVAGKIVVCDRGENRRAEKGLVVREAGGIGMIIANTDLNEDDQIADAHLIPTAAVGQTAGDMIKEYISSTRNPTATIAFGETKLGVQPSPVVAAFSSRGPNSITPEILKPDFIAPGVNILASWTRRVGPTGLAEDKRHVDFNIISGTSMSCPHVSGLAALLKTAHPEWSPAAIKSALLTTAYSTYKNGQTIEDAATSMPSTPFDHGAGHVNPVSALDPGLVYDATVDDYTNFLCAIGYSASMIKTVTKRDISCGTNKEYRVADFNYPSFAVPLETAWGKAGDNEETTVVKYTRTLTNVGNPATYKASVSFQTKSMKIIVEPQTLSFSRLNEKKSYTVTFIASSMPSGTTSFAHLEWSDGKHNVRSPIAFSWT
nr:subtilisin-like protease SBT1.7 [Ipomoea batatas]GMD99435.1 subtilisin-like protease SBT1.7 [Ipomoea batatas]